MRKLILYATKYGACEKCAKQIGENIHADVSSFEHFIGDIHSYETIVLGSSVYAGMFHKEMKKFCNTNQIELKEKQVWIFVCGMLKEDTEIRKELYENLGEDFIKDIKGYFAVGAILDMKKLNFMERKLIQMINKKVHFMEDLKKDESYDLLDQEAIQKFIQVLS